MPSFPTIGSMFKHLIPLLQEPRVANVALFRLVQFLFAFGGGYGQGAARAGGFRGSMTNGTTNKSARYKRRHSDISNFNEAWSSNGLRSARALGVAQQYNEGNQPIPQGCGKRSTIFGCTRRGREEIQHKRGNWVYSDPEMGCQMGTLGWSFSARIAQGRGLVSISRHRANPTEDSGSGARKRNGRERS